MVNRLYRIWITIVQNLDNGMYRNCTTNTIDYTETTPETTTENKMSDKSDDSIPFKEIIEYLNEKTDNSYKPSAEGHKKFIRARWHEGNTIDDFKTVIDPVDDVTFPSSAGSIFSIDPLKVWTVNRISSGFMFVS